MYCRYSGITECIGYCDNTITYTSNTIYNTLSNWNICL